MEKILDNEQFSLLQSRLSEARKVVCVCHVNPDGDALGSTLALAAWMKQMGKECQVVVPNRFPDFLRWMPGVHEIVRHDKHPETARNLLREADFIWVCDMSQSSRALEMEDVLNECASRDEKSLFMVLVDHHLSPQEGFCHLQISYPEMCATCEVVCHLLWQWGRLEQLSPVEATCLYTGMMTDTGGFSYNSNRPVVFECISKLLLSGIDKDKIYRNVFYSGSEARLRLVGYLLYVKMEIVPGLKASVMTLTNEERKLLGVKNGDTEGIVNMPLQIQGMKLSVFISEDTEHPEFVKFSLRSVDDFPCNELSARFFSGGGHKNAAGGRLCCTMEEALVIFRQAVQAYASLLE